MDVLLLVALAGFCASLVDGALGMGFGPTSSSILLGAGLSPAAVSGTVNLAKVATGIVAAISHWRFRNIDHRLVLQLAIPGCVGAVAGVTVLSQVDGDTLRPILAAMLILVGIRILVRFSTPVAMDRKEFTDVEHDPDRMPPFDARGVVPCAAVGGVTNGLIGAWGPIVTPFLLHRGLSPRVAAVAAGSILAAAGEASPNWQVVTAMLGGGVIGAPVAAWSVRHLPARPMGLAVAALLLLTNARELGRWYELGWSTWFVYGAIV